MKGVRNFIMIKYWFNKLNKKIWEFIFKIIILKIWWSCDNEKGFIELCIIFFMWE